MAIDAFVAYRATCRDCGAERNPPDVGEVESEIGQSISDTGESELLGLTEKPCHECGSRRVRFASG